MPQGGSESREKKEPVLHLRQALAGVSASLAALDNPGSGYVVGTSPRAPLLDGYVSHMLIAHLESRHVAVRPFHGRIEGAPPAPPQLPKPLLQELRVAGADMFIQAATSLEEGQRYLSAASYATSDGRPRVAIRSPFHLSEEMEALVSGERSRVGAEDRSWLELFEEMFPPVPQESDPARYLELAEAAYFFESGLWKEAGRMYLEASQPAPNRPFLCAIMALQFGGEGERAAAELDSALNHYPDSGPLWALRSWLGFRRRRPEDALMWLEQARLCG
ncbi:MAG: tetratricopeptide repeat protein, partial [Planctomycetota bacterium]